MQTTSEILKALAPEFVPLDEAERKATPGEWRINSISSSKKSRICVSAPMTGEFAFNKRHIAQLEYFSDEDAYNADFIARSRIYVRALLDAYAQALAEQEWQPIETAPKDGRTIIGWSRYMSEPCTIRWGKIYQRFSATLEGWASCWEGAEVIRSEHDFGTDYKDPEPVTHWLPMPLPPQEFDA